MNSGLAIAEINVTAYEPKEIKIIMTKYHIPVYLRHSKYAVFFRICEQMSSQTTHYIGFIVKRTD